MELRDIIIYGIIALVVMFVLPKLGIKGRGGNSPLNPPGRNPGNPPAGDGGGIFPDMGGGAEKPKASASKPDTTGGFADRVEGDRPEKRT
jgi:hypothetical protein